MESNLNTMRTHIFVSYCHRDSKWLSRLQIHLKPLLREGKIDLWDDTRLRPGTNWREVIDVALMRAKVAILLISADFLASEFIVNQELPPLLAAAESDGALILPVIISPSYFEKTALGKFQAVNDPSKPLNFMTKAKQEEIWLKVAVEIDKALMQLATEKPKKQNMRPPKVFVSYSHRDEIFKDELLMMLTVLQRQGVIDIWQDRSIQAGDEWFNVVVQAMNDSDMAILLVSPDFIASQFIQEEERATLLKRRAQEGMSIIPIIVRPCLWQSEPMLKDLQVLPADGKPIISFSKENGDRDQILAEIAVAIESHAKARTTL